jgi:hypothetical protein
MIAFTSCLTSTLVRWHVIAEEIDVSLMRCKKVLELQLKNSFGQGFACICICRESLGSDVKYYSFHDTDSWSPLITFLAIRMFSVSAFSPRSRSSFF